ncbi:MAG: 3-dehydroquinate synthase [Gemmatimonadota bacterium]|nr:3-dehydroquinate synthase [Gemmatimonadota bacterium]MDP6802074.1 3-dehydroquinate synthase [Gemmatimonadota bacterium]MDP7032454.1 3-dehydroquinate synthase [Gemmatimonadota bacterium]
MNESRRVAVPLGGRTYEVVIGHGECVAWLRGAVEAAGAGRVALVSDSAVHALHGEMLQDAIGGEAVLRVTLSSGESCKTLAEAERVCGELVDGGMDRGDLILGFGGGAATDLAGFVAGVLFRGMKHLLVPTTLLAQVDASVGGKTGVNLPGGKNLVGVFHQPGGVVCDTLFLETLPEREFRSGMAEVVKTAWLGDGELLDLLEANPPARAPHPGLEEIVERCIRVKAAVVARDERESGPREVLNFGHTLGHAIETEARGRLLHGEAVSLGLVAALYLSVETGRCASRDLDRMVSLLARLGLPVRDERLDSKAVVARTRVDKKRRGGRDRYQLTAGVQAVSVAENLPDGAAEAAVEFLRSR